STMLTSIADGLLCCLLGKTPNAVGPLDSVESGDGYSFLEVKPGRILRIRHSIPKRPEFPEEPEKEEEATGRGTVRCKRRITLYRNGQLLIENLGDAVRSEILQCHNSSGGDPGSAVELEMPEPAAGIPGCGGARRDGAATPGKRRKRKPKKVVTVDCQKRITSCKGTHGDVVLFFIHGVGGSLDIWKEQLEFFSKLGYEVVAPDLAGHGCSSAPPVAAAYTFYALAEDMRAVFKRYAKKRNILIGHSYGVSFCTFLAHEYPELVHKVIMINGGGPTALEPSLCSIFNLPPCVLHCLSPCLAWSFLNVGFWGAGVSWCPSEGSSWHCHTRGRGQCGFLGGRGLLVPLRGVILALSHPREGTVAAHRCPAHPQILLIAFLKVIDEGSHMVMLECPDTVNTLLHEFVLWEPDTLSGDGDG
ncbi:ABHD8 protein, partial [Dicrurus megarhynchus]|nr:ABHD8 protein [Dicrurus megarhynchus]